MKFENLCRSGTGLMQPIIYIDRFIFEKTQARYKTLDCFFSFNKLSTVLTVDDFIIVLALNRAAKKSPNKHGLKLPLAIGDERILNLWGNSIADNIMPSDIYPQIETTMRLGKDKEIFNNYIDNQKVNENESIFNIFDDNMVIVVVFNNLKVLRDKEQMEKLKFDIARTVVQTYHRYHIVGNVAKTDWFKLYLSLL